MNPAVLKIALLGSRSSWGRMAGIGGGVAIGVCLVLLLWSAANGLAQRDARGAWLREMGQSSVTVPLAADGLTANGRPEPIPLAPDKILLGFPQDIFRDQPISHRDIAALPTTTVKIPGIQAPPAPGQYYASPALQRLIESTPAEELGDRYGKFVGIIDDSALPGPDALVVITGVTEAQLRQGPAAMLVTEFTTNPYGESASLYRTALLVGGIAVLFPVLLLVSIATGLGAAQRRERFATLRLIGASPRLVAGMAAVETAVPSLAGALLGVVLAWSSGRPQRKYPSTAGGCSSQISPSRRNSPWLSSCWSSLLPHWWQHAAPPGPASARWESPGPCPRKPPPCGGPSLCWPD